MAGEQLADDVVDDVALESAEGETPEAEEDDEIVVTIGESPAPEGEVVDEFAGQPAPAWAKELRKTSREDKRKIRELEAALAKPAEKVQPAALGNKPRLEDFEYDSDQYEKALESWHDRKITHDAEQAKSKQAEESQRQAWQAKQDGYVAEKSKIKIKDFEDAEAVVQETLSIEQQSIILHGLDSRTAAIAVAAIGSNPKKAKELAAIKDPVMFAIALGELKKEMTVTTRKATPPEKTVTGSASISGTVSGSALERLKVKAQQTGDYSEYFAAKRKANSK